MLGAETCHQAAIEESCRGVKRGVEAVRILTEDVVLGGEMGAKIDDVEA